MIGPKTPRMQGATLRRNAYRVVDDRDEYIDCRTGLYLGPDRAEHHHRQFLGRGGEDTPENLVTLLGPGNAAGTHGWAHGEREARLLGYAIPGWVTDVAMVPIHRVLPKTRRIGWALQQGALVVPVTEEFAAERMTQLGIWTRGERP